MLFFSLPKEFFFPGKVYTSLTRLILKPGKKKQRRKKKTLFSITHPIIAKKWSKQTFPGKKKYGWEMLDFHSTTN